MKLITVIDRAEVWADQDRIKVFLNSDSKTWDFHPLWLVYILQKYQDNFKLRGSFNPSEWQGIMGSNE